MNYPLRFTIIAFLLLAGVAGASAQDQLWRHLDRPYGGDIFFFRNAPSGAIYTAGEHSGMYRSLDEGATWNEFGTQTSGLMPVLITTQNAVFAISDDDGGIFRSTDDGANWARTAQGVMNIEPGFMVETSTGTILMGTRQGIYRSTNNGSAWTSVGLTDVEFRFLAASPDGTIFGASNDSGLYRSSDDGLTWTGVGSMHDAPADAFLFLGGGEIILATDNGIFRSTDNGDSFTPFALAGRPIGPFSLARLPGGDLIAAVRNHDLFRISPDGSIVTPLGAPSDNLAASTVTSSGNIVAGYGGRGILLSTDEGATFQTVGIPYGVGVRNFAEAPDGSIYVMPSGPGLYRTSDRGENWTTLPLPGNGARFVAFAPSGTIFVAGQQGEAYRSTDNGATWTSLVTNVGPDFSGAIVTESGAVIMTSNGGIIRSTDDGESWTEFWPEENVYGIAESPNGDLTAIGFGRIFRSNDEGENWESLDLPEEYRNSSRFYMIATPVDGTIVLGGYESSGNGENILRSTDNGATWSTVDFPCSTFALSPATEIPGTMYASSTCGIYRSVDAGATWSLFANLPEDQNFGVFLADSHGDIWFGADDGIYIASGSSAVPAVHAETGAALSLRLFPNPSRGPATAEFTLGSRQDVTLSLRTLLGKTVAVLLDGPVEAGSHAIRFDRDLPAGFYLLHLRAGQSVTSTMIQMTR